MSPDTGLRERQRMRYGADQANRHALPQVYRRGERPDGGLRYIL